MTPQRWQQVKSVLAGALECEDTRARLEFVRATCADDAALACEVQSLLDQPAEDFDSVADTIGFAHSEELAPDESGRRLGAYELVCELGRGGMGTVWLARRADEQFEKLVALKLLKRGTDTDEVLGRFHAERRILARLDHPNIARLFDAGMTEDHLPFFVMEYVQGLRVTDFIRERKLSLGERLQLFLKICAAVQFAHQNLVVHRDLKPGNILVTAEQEPKLLDFGVAKLLVPGSDAWQLTSAGQERFTPGYASPEQMLGEPITTVSDVYLLGAVLFEMLTGRPPHQLSGSTISPTQMTRVVCETAPPRASAVATEPEMRTRLRGDLDNILDRALARSPERRYRGAGTLGDDVRRYLEHRPVRARPDTVGYRTAKFLRRHRKASIATALIFLSLLGGAGATFRQAQIADLERVHALERATQVRMIANSFMEDFYDLLAGLPGSLPARQLMLGRAVDYLDSLAREKSEDRALASELALAYTKIGSVTFDVAQAIALHEKAVALNEHLVRQAPENFDYQRQLSNSYGQLSDLMKIAGRSTRAIAYARSSLALTQSLARRKPGTEKQAALAACQVGLAVALADAGDFREALAQSQSALASYRALPADQEVRRGLEGALRQISEDKRELGETDWGMEETRAAFRIASELFEQRPDDSRSQRDLWAAHFSLAKSLAASGDLLGARDHFTSALSLMEALAAAEARDTGHQRWLAVTRSALGDTLGALGLTAEALALETRALVASERLAQEDGSRAEVRRDIVQINLSLGHLCEQTGEGARATGYYDAARVTAEALLALEPANAAVRRALEDAKHQRR